MCAVFFSFFLFKSGSVAITYQPEHSTLYIQPRNHKLMDTGWGGGGTGGQDMGRFNHNALGGGCKAD